MRRLTLVIPCLVSDPDHESALRQLPPALQETVEKGTVVKLSPIDDAEFPEAAYIGLNPLEHPVSQGPLTVAALGHVPPEGSVHFHLSLCSIDQSGIVGEVVEQPSEDEVGAVMSAVQDLRTKTITPLVGELCDHALVWEGGSLENRVTPFTKALNHPLETVMPQGEGDEVLRKFIDDSVNLLDALEINHVRREEGRTPLNGLWPWGPGFRPNLPNLPIRRGDVAWIESASLRLQGLARLVGYRHGERSTFLKGMTPDFALLHSQATRRQLTLALVDGVTEMQRHERLEEIQWTLSQMSSLLIEPLLVNGHDEPFEFRIAAPGAMGTCASSRTSREGLGLFYSSLKRGLGTLPFDERALDDRRIATYRTQEFVLGGLMGTV